ncbi:MAG: hypothetical protein ACLUI3_09645 [Christensenellales bacterium]
MTRKAVAAARLRTEDGAENVGAIQIADGETAWTVGAAWTWSRRG